MQLLPTAVPEVPHDDLNASLVMLDYDWHEAKHEAKHDAQTC